MTTDSLKCFVISDDDPEQTRVMFVKSSIEAKRWWSNHFWNGDEIAGISARRKPEWDQFATTGVPALAMIDDGWWFECHGCGTRISDEFIGTRDRLHRGWEDYQLDREYGEDLTIPVMEPVEASGQRVWCCQQCRDDDEAERALIKNYGERVKVWLMRAFMRRYPELCPAEGLGDGYSNPRSHVYIARRKGRLTVEQVIIHFSWPTAKIGLGTYRIDQQWHYGEGKPRRAELYVAGGDKAAFEAFMAPRTEVAA